jgi:hypothetical protein
VKDLAEVPSAGDILQGVAAKLGLTAEQVERSLAEANISLKSPAAADRRLRMLRLRASGVKHSGEPFTVERDFSGGVWAIVHPDNRPGRRACWSSWSGRCAENRATCRWTSAPGCGI